jgi:hypothetical protein
MINSARANAAHGVTSSSSSSLKKKKKNCFNDKRTKRQSKRHDEDDDVSFMTTSRRGFNSGTDDCDDLRNTVKEVLVTTCSAVMIISTAFGPGSYAFADEDVFVVDEQSSAGVETRSSEEGERGQRRQQEEEEEQPTFQINAKELDISAYDAMTRTGGNSDKARAMVNKQPQPKMSSPLNAKDNEEGLNPILIVAPLALGGFAFGASKLIGGPLVERSFNNNNDDDDDDEEEEDDNNNIEAAPKTLPSFQMPKIEAPSFELPEITNPLKRDPLPPDAVRKSFPKRSAASFNLGSQDEKVGEDKQTYDALSESYDDGEEMRKAQKELVKAEREAEREEKKLEQAQLREEKKREQEQKREEQKRERELKRQEQERLKREKADELVQRKQEQERAKASASDSSTPVQTLRKVKTFSNKKSESPAPFAKTQKVRTANDDNNNNGLPSGFPTLADFEGLTKDEKIEICDKADEIVARLELKAEAAENFLDSPVVNFLFFLKPTAEKNAEKARADAETASAAARSLRSAASSPIAGPGAAIAAAVVAVIAAAALLLGNVSGAGLSSSSSVSGNAKAPIKTERVKDIEAMASVEAALDGKISAADAYASFTRRK